MENFTTKTLRWGDLPKFFKGLLDSFEEKDRYMMLLSILTVVGSVLPRVFGQYDGKKVYPNLFLYVLGKAGSGKGNVTWAKNLVQNIEYDSNEVESRPLGVAIPANITSAGLTDYLNKLPEGGLMFETEGDTMVNMFNSEHGRYSDMLRKCFHHETISHYRKTDSEYSYISEPKMSVVLTSTPKQMQALIKDAENGLFSRFMYCFTQQETEFRDVFSKQGEDKLNSFEEAGKQLVTLNESLMESENIEFRLTSEQQSQFVAFFQKNKDIILEFASSDLDATVNRTAIITFRIMMILSVIRIQDVTKVDQIVCDDIDFKTSMEIAELLIGDSLETFKSLPQATPDDVNEWKLQFLQSIGDEFTIKEAHALAERLNISTRSIERFLRTRFFEKIARGRYRKVDI